MDLWPSVREHAASAIGLVVSDVLWLLAKLKQCEDELNVDSFTNAAMAIFKLQNSKMLRSVTDFIEECAFAFAFIDSSSRVWVQL